jgi:DNA-binding NtrC family response regulator
VLQNAGFVVRTASNGLEALIAAFEMRPAVIVMDVTMPVLDGLEATRLIKAADATRHARVIAFTADSTLRLDAAAGGSILIHDVEEMSPTVQRVLVDVLAELEFARASSAAVRLMTGATVSLLDCVVAGTFSDRLFYRLNTIHLVAAKGDS